MDQPDKLTVTITGDQAERIRESVARGEFESPEDMVAAALDKQQHAARLADLKRQIADAVNDPRPPLTIDEVRARMAESYEKAERDIKLKASRRGAA